MKRFSLFLLFWVLISLTTWAADKKDLTLTGATLTEGSTEWYYQNATDSKTELQAGDLIIVFFDKVTSDDGNCQYAICDFKGNKIYTDGADEKWKCYTCKKDQKDFSLTVSQDLCSTIHAEGFGIQFKGLSNIKVQYVRMSDDYSQYKPANAIELKTTPLYITDWYSDCYLLKTTSDYIGKTLRVICAETTDDSYAFLKKKDNEWSALMSGSDKFSIAGWKYFEIKINSELNNLLKEGDGLLIGGNNYIIAGIYVYGDNTSAPDWKEEDADIEDVFTIKDDWRGKTYDTGWSYTTIPGNVFEYKNENGTSIPTQEKISNTKNNIIRLIFDKTNSTAQVSAKDGDEKSNAYFTRERKGDKNGGPTDENGQKVSPYYTNFADCPNTDHYDFSLSDAIAIFEDYNKVKTGEEGVKTGMLSTLLKNGMTVGSKDVKITKVEIRKALVSKYVTGYAVYTGHHLSDTEWRTVALPYNLTASQLKETFGNDVRICELGESKVTKTPKDNSFQYGINFNFTKIGENAGINANYPYLIKLGSAANVHADDRYFIKDVKADLRDFQAYEFRTEPFDVSALNAPESDTKLYNYEKNIKDKLTKDVYMIFKSTAPVFDITNNSVGEVENIKGVKNDGRTILEIPSNNGNATNYFLRDNTLYPVLNDARRMTSGLAYVVLPAATKGLFDEDPDGNTQEAKVSYNFDEGNDITGIKDIESTCHSPRPQDGIYNLSGQLIQKSNNADGLAKGIYIIAGKKVIIK